MGAGNVYVADSFNNTIRKITPAGRVTTVAGIAGTKGHADGAGGAASFHEPDGIAIDGAGNIYVADAGNRTIRKINPAGVVSTLAGSAGTEGHADGIGNLASFGLPLRLAIGRDGNLYVSDAGNSTIRKVTQDGTVTTLAGTLGAVEAIDGVGAAASFGMPQGVALDSAGNFLIADGIGKSIRRVTPDGAVTTLIRNADSGDNTDGTGFAARLHGPKGIATDNADNVYVADATNCNIRKITPQGGGATQTAPGPRRASMHPRALRLMAPEMYMSRMPVTTLFARSPRREWSRPSREEVTGGMPMVWVARRVSMHREALPWIARVMFMWQILKTIPSAKSLRQAL